MSITIAFVNGKGGVGKTTLASLAAVVLKETNFSVAIDDRDPQKGATNDAKAFGIPVGQNAEYVIIDTAPNLESPDTLDAIKTADHLVLVTTPSSKDLDTTVETARIIERIRTSGHTVVVFNRVLFNSKAAARIPEVKKLLPFPAIDILIPRRQAYEDIGMLGWKSLDKTAQVETVKLVAGILDKVLAS